MEETTSQHHHTDRVPSASTSTSSAGDRALVPDSLTEQPLSLQDERISSANPSLDAAITGASKNVTDQPATSDTSGVLNTVYPVNAYSPVEQTYYYGASGYDNSNNNMSEYSNFVNANSLPVIPPGMYNDNPSLLFHSAYGFDTQMPYGQFSPMANPLSPIMLDGQLYSPHQIPVSPPYYPPVSPGLPHATSALSLSQTELMSPGNIGQEALSDNMVFGPGSGYFVQFGSFGGGNLSGNSNVGLYKFPGDFGPNEQLSNRTNPSDSSSFLSPLTSGGLYPQPIGILGQYEHNITQVSQPQTPYHGLGLVSNTSTRRYPQGSSYRSSNYGVGSISHWDAGRLSRLTPEKGGRRDRDRDTVSASADSHVISSDRNRGPRALKPKGKSLNDEKNASPGVNKNIASTSGHHLEFNRSDFLTDYENAKFFVIKSFSEDNVHKSIKYSIWASTPLGNRKLDAAYREAKELKDNCLVFLLFSVNASGQFCGVAEMVGPVDFENDADYWQQDRWSGQFPVKWHIIKDVPNSRFRHILLENNDNKPVTHSRDSQEVKLEQGIEMLKILKDYEADTSILDDFNFYDEKERVLQEKKARQRNSTTSGDPVVLSGASINQLSDNLAETLRLGESKEVLKVE